MGKQDVKDIIMFLIGASAFLHEAFLGAIDRPAIIIGALTLMGLPLATRIINGKDPSK